MREGLCDNIVLIMRPSIRGLIVEVSDYESNENWRTKVDYIDLKVPCNIKYDGVLMATMEFDDLVHYKKDIDAYGKSVLIVG